MRKIVSIILIIVGLLLIFYPIIGKIIYKLNQTDVIEKFKEKVSQMDDEEKEQKRNNIYELYNSSNTGELIGYIQIEKINVYLPIYDGTTDKVLLKGVGHLENTPLPNSKKAYHSVFVGHSGITAKTIFDDLIKLELKDYFSVTILDETYKYEICDIKTVLPDNVESLEQQKGDKGELVTLVTCTPKYINSHRLLVTGKCVEKNQNNDEFILTD